LAKCSDDYDGNRKLQQATRIPIATGENEYVACGALTVGVPLAVAALWFARESRQARSERDIARADRDAVRAAMHADLARRYDDGVTFPRC
jgi:hypothetical protein